MNFTLTQALGNMIALAGLAVWIVQFASLERARRENMKLAGIDLPDRSSVTYSWRRNLGD